jgi:hypothetical protein
MQIRKMTMSISENGGKEDLIVECREVRGVVTKAEVYMKCSIIPENILEIEVNGEDFGIRGSAIPRIDAGEEIILHIHPEIEYEVVGYQILKNGRAVQRVVWTPTGPASKPEKIDNAPEPDTAVFGFE